jgi:hypothetical protein
MQTKEEETQERIKLYLEKKKEGLNFNENLKKQKEFSNPKILHNVRNETLTLKDNSSFRN